jgi:hypothetical protein
MPSTAYRTWKTMRAGALDEIEAAHASIGGKGPGRRYATQQINQAYAVLLASQFQGYCRDLHTESVTHLIAFRDPPAAVRHLVQTGFTQGRQLDSKNAHRASIGSDFKRLGIDFWPAVYKDHAKNEERATALDLLNDWRNAIAHHDYSRVSPSLRLARVQRWRAVCGRLVISFEEVMRSHLRSLIGKPPWPPRGA